MKRLATVLMAPAGLVGCLILGGCGLPTPSGVQSAGEVTSERQQADALSVRPPGPVPGATPQQIVRGFLAAQSSPDDRYAVARSFLAADAGWNPAAGVRIVSTLPPPPAVAPPAEGGQVRVELERDVLGRIGVDGWSEAVDRPDQAFRYDLVRVQGQWRLVSVPEGLTLTEDDRERSMAVVQVMFLSPSTGRPHLVSDLVRVPNGDQLARRLVQQVIDGPSEGLAGSAATAVPEGTRVLTVTHSPAGEVTADLAMPVSQLTGPEREKLSAQLLWTLRLGLEKYNQEFTSMRLLVQGKALEVDGDSGPQPANRWQGWDPTAGMSPADALAVAAGGRAVSIEPDGRLRPAFQPEASNVPEPEASNVVEPEASNVVEPEALNAGSGRVVELVQDAFSERVAVLTGSADGGLRSLVVGSRTGQEFTAVRRDQELVSPSWGDGTHGVWSLRVGADPAVLVDEPGQHREVMVTGPMALSPVSVLRVSRDGARVALIDDSRTLWVGRVEIEGTQLRIVDRARLSLPGQRIRDVAWLDATTVLALDANPDPDIPRPLLQIDIDGVLRSQTSLNTSGDANTRTVTAWGPQALVGAVDPPSLQGGQPRFTIYRRVNGVFSGTDTQVTGAVRPRLPD